jgi:hypothetical protein
LKLYKLNISRHGFQAHREMVRVMLVLKTFLDSGVTAINENLIASCICGREKREAHYVVPMGMAYQEVDRAFALTAGSLHEFDTELSDAGAGIEYYCGVVTADFNARSVTAGCGSLIVG